MLGRTLATGSEAENAEKDCEESTHRVSLLPNGSRLSCGRDARGRKEAESLIELVGEATQFLPT